MGENSQRKLMLFLAIAELLCVHDFLIYNFLGTVLNVVHSPKSFQRSIMSGA